MTRTLDGTPDPDDHKEVASRLVVVEGNAVALKLIVTWPLVQGQRQKRTWKEEKWARVSGVRIIHVQAMWDVLFGNGFCRHDGTNHPVAALFARRELKRRLDL